MSLPKERKRSLNLDKDLVLSKEHLGAIETSQLHDPMDLGSYLDFLDEVWRSERKEPGKKFFSEKFLLDRKKEGSRRS